ncbi:MAG: PASTA domain-containing protein, partial [Lachnospiraceae bacterium]|nr:PASTA domain-containing protein [Lachnospiraceae bacterium]
SMGSGVDHFMAFVYVLVMFLVAAGLVYLIMHVVKKGGINLLPGSGNSSFIVTSTPTPTSGPSVSPTPKIIYMPSYLGLDYNVAIQKLNTLGVKLNIRWEAAKEYSDEYPNRGQVISQYPVSGEPLNDGDTVLFTFSIGKEPFVVGNYKGLTEAQVRAAIGDKLNIRLEWTQSDAVPKDCVVDTIPGANEQIAAGGTITIILCSGELKFTDVPNVVGLTEVEALAKLMNASFKYKTERAYSDTVPEGKVISQSPAANSGKVEKGTAILLTISSGVAPTSTPTPPPVDTPTPTPAGGETPNTPTPKPANTPTPKPANTPTPKPQNSPTPKSDAGA